MPLFSEGPDNACLEADLSKRGRSLGLHSREHLGGLFEELFDRLVGAKRG